MATHKTEYLNPCGAYIFQTILCEPMPGGGQGPGLRFRRASGLCPGRGPPPGQILSASGPPLGAKPHGHIGPILDLKGALAMSPRREIICFHAYQDPELKETGPTYCLKKPKLGCDEPDLCCQCCAFIDRLTCLAPTQHKNTYGTWPCSLAQKAQAVNLQVAQAPDGSNYKAPEYTGAGPAPGTRNTPATRKAWARKAGRA